MDELLLIIIVLLGLILIALLIAISLYLVNRSNSKIMTYSYMVKEETQKATNNNKAKYNSDLATVMECGESEVIDLENDGGSKKK